jgi:hypothetical protein
MIRMECASVNMQTMAAIHPIDCITVETWKQSDGEEQHLWLKAADWFNLDSVPACGVIICFLHFGLSVLRVLLFRATETARQL